MTPSSRYRVHKKEDVPSLGQPSIQKGYHEEVGKKNTLISLF